MNDELVTKLADEIEAMLRLPEAEMKRKYGDPGWKLLIYQYINNTAPTKPDVTPRRK